LQRFGALCDLEIIDAISKMRNVPKIEEAIATILRYRGTKGAVVLMLRWDNLSPIYFADSDRIEFLFGATEFPSPSAIAHATVIASLVRMLQRFISRSALAPVFTGFRGNRR
jgi:hypothetical protein